MLKILLSPLSLLYGIVVGVRNLLFDFGFLPSKEFDLAVISIGNITVGGTGKTPHTEYIATILKEKFKIAVLSRGYKRKTTGFEVATAESTTAQIGDELKQVKTKFPNIVVAADTDRINGIEQICKKFPETKAIILDDAYQHRKVKAGLSILLIDYNRMLNKDMLLPAGRLREGKKQVKRANIVVVTKCPTNLKPIEMRTLSESIKLSSAQTIYFSAFEYGELQPLFPKKALYINRKICFEEKYSALTLSGIANPKPFTAFAKAQFTEIETFEFPDHYNFTLPNIIEAYQRLKNLPTRKKIILLTEKDAVKIKEIKKIPNNIKEILFYIPIKPKILNNKEADFEQQILKLVSFSKSIS